MAGVEVAQQVDPRPLLEGQGVAEEHDDAPCQAGIQGLGKAPQQLSHSHVSGPGLWGVLQLRLVVVRWLFGEQVAEVLHVSRGVQRCL